MAFTFVEVIVAYTKKRKVFCKEKKKHNAKKLKKLNL